MKRRFVLLLSFLTFAVIACLAFVTQGGQMTLAASPPSLGFIYHSNWWNATQFSADAARYRTVAGDFNNDGLDDIAMLFRRTWPTPANVVYWMLGAGDHFDWQGINSSWSEDANHTGTVVAGDFDNDDYDDVATFTENGSILYWFSDGSNFPQHWVMPVLPASPGGNYRDQIAGRVVAGDFDGDGLGDDIAAFWDHGGIGRLQVFLSTGSAFHYRTWWSSSGTDFDVSRVSYRVVAGDFNNDGRDDVAAVYDEGSNGARMPVWLSSSFDPTGVSFGSFSYHPNWWSDTAYDASSVTGRVAAGDFDGDGDDDISLLHEDPADANHIRAHILLSTRQHFAFQGYDPGWWDHYSYIPSYATGRVVVGDWDGDGVDDLSVIYGSSTFARAQVLKSTALPPGLASTRTVDKHDPSCDDGTGTPYCTVQAAVDVANDGDAVMVAAGTYSEHVILPRYGIEGFNQSLTVQGAGSATTIVDGDASGTVFTIHRGGQMALSDLTIRNGSADENGGGIANLGGELTVSNSTILSNTTASSGGGVYNLYGGLAIYDSILGDNMSELYGGGIYNIGGTVNLKGSIVSGNYSAINGGGIYSVNGGLAIQAGSVSENVADSDGGGIYNLGGGPLSIGGSVVSDNSALRFGGGISNHNSAAMVSGSSIRDNTVGFRGGGIYNQDSSLNIADSTLTNNSTLVNNQSINDGGGLYALNGDLTVSNSTFSGNSANSAYGGALYASGDATLMIHNSTFNGNSAGFLRGGIYAEGGVIVTLANAIVANTAGGDCAGPGLWNTAGAPNLDSDGSCPGFTITGNPLLGPLQHNGGATQTHALLDGSPAIDAGSNAACLTTDQRGLPRPQDGDGDGMAVCDLGSFEVGLWTIHLPLVVQS